MRPLTYSEKDAAHALCIAREHNTAEGWQTFCPICRADIIRLVDVPTGMPDVNTEAVDAAIREIIRVRSNGGDYASARDMLIWMLTPGTAPTPPATPTEPKNDDE